MKYRAEIDGLRSVAVVPVILFHAGLEVFSGGFIGVDVFFVISGYLITWILAEELARSNFSILEFYERRARRILPALSVVTLATVPFAWMWMMPDDLQRYAQSLVAVSTFSSNILFWTQSGYFAPNADEIPLLHTWSLAVEEQYYIIFPLLLLLLWRIGKWRTVFIALTVMAIGSLLLSEYTATRYPSANFYMLPTRAWELLAGSLVALWQLRGPERTQAHSQVFAALGLAAIITSILLFDENTPFPSFWAILPVGGTALIILFAAPGTLVARLLSVKPMVAIGLISYSAYLVHQPLFAFARLRSLSEPSLAMMMGLTVVTFLLAWAIWLFIETPFRKRDRFSRPAILSISFAGLVAFAAVGAVGHLASGFPGRLSETVLAAAAAGEERNPREWECFRTPTPAAHPIPACQSGEAPRIALVGDSHNAALSSILHNQLVTKGFGVYESSRSGCIPIRGLHRFNEVRAECDAYNQVLHDYLMGDEVEVIVLTGRWSVHVLGTRFDNQEGGREAGAGWRGVDLVSVPISGAWPDDTSRKPRVLEHIRREILAMAAQKKVVIIYPVPEAGWDVSQTLAKHLLLEGSPPDLSTSGTIYDQRHTDIMALFDSLESNNLFRVRPAEVFCDSLRPDRCLTVLDDASLYRDDDHLSREGAKLLTPEIIRVLETALATD